jgi:hypothetical protein
MEYKLIKLIELNLIGVTNDQDSWKNPMILEVEE